MTGNQKVLRLMDWGDKNTSRETGKMQALASSEEKPKVHGEVIQWVVAAQGGDLDAFAQLVKRYSKAVSMTAYSIVGDWEAAQDIAQDVFLKALRSVGGLQQPGAFAGWLMSVARNQAISYLRRRDLEDRTWEQLAQASLRERPVGKESADLHRLEQALSKLPQGYREVLQLKYMQNSSLAEIAAVLGMTEAGTETRLKRARKLLQAAWRSVDGAHMGGENR